MPRNADHNTQDIKPAQLRIPYRDDILISADAFIRHCDQFGVRVRHSELELLEREKILFPAVRVHPGYVELRKFKADFGGYESYKDEESGETKERWIERIEWRYSYPEYFVKEKGKTYFLTHIPSDRADPKVQQDNSDRKECLEVDPHLHYSLGSFIKDRKNWLDFFRKQGMLLDPVRQKFRPWKEYWHGDVTITSNKKELGEFPYGTYYSPYQRFALQSLQRFRVSIGWERYFYNEKQWQKTTKNTRGISDPKFYVPQMKRAVVEQNQFFTAYFFIRDFWQEAQEQLDQRKKELFEEAFTDKVSDLKRISAQQNEREIRRMASEMAQKSMESAAVTYWDRRVKSTFPKQAKKLLTRKGWKIEWLKSWRDSMLWMGIFNAGLEYKEVRKAILPHLTDEVLCEADEAYEVAYHLNWFLSLCGQQQPSLNADLLGRYDVRYCEICQRPFKHSRRNQVTCASLVCIKEYRNAFKREQRKVGRYA